MGWWAGRGGIRFWRARGRYRRRGEVAVGLASKHSPLSRGKSFHRPRGGLESCPLAQAVPEAFSGTPKGAARANLTSASSQMFEESKQALLNGVTTMREQMKSPRISKYAPPFVHAVASSSRRRKQEGNTPKSVHWIVLVSQISTTRPPSFRTERPSSRAGLVYGHALTRLSIPVSLFWLDPWRGSGGAGDMRPALLHVSHQVSTAQAPTPGGPSISASNEAWVEPQLPLVTYKPFFPVACVLISLSLSLSLSCPLPPRLVNRGKSGPIARCALVLLSNTPCRLRAREVREKERGEREAFRPGSALGTTLGATYDPLARSLARSRQESDSGKASGREPALLVTWEAREEKGRGKTLVSARFFTERAEAALLSSRLFICPPRATTGAFREQRERHR